jgi:hypothetical protein
LGEAIENRREGGHGRRSESAASGKKGFALVAALMAIWILTAVGVLVFTVSTQDIRISGRLVCEKKGFSATETGLYWLTANFLYDNPSASAVPLQKLDTSLGSPVDANDRYSIGPGSIGKDVAEMGAALSGAHLDAAHPVRGIGMLRDMLRLEGILGGVSAGAVVHVARKLAAELEEGVVVAILADGGWKYLSADFWEVAADDVGESMESTVWW